MKNTSNKRKDHTRWQIRIKDPDLEKWIRDLSQKENRSINQTIIYLITKYRENLKD